MPPSATTSSAAPTAPTLSVADAQSNATPTDVTQPAPATEATQLGNTIGAQADQFQQNLDQNAATAYQNYQTPLTQYLSALSNSQGKDSITNSVYNQLGVDGKQQSVNDLNGQILAEKTATAHTIDNLKNNNPQGFFGTGMQQAIQKVQDQSNMRLADLAVQKYVANNDYTSAINTATRMVNAQYEQQQNYLAALKATADSAKENWTTAEKQAFDAMMATRNSELALSKAETLAHVTESIKQQDPLYQAQLRHENMLTQKGANGTSLASDLQDAESAIKQGADPNKVRQAFLGDHPSSSSEWDAYFTDAQGNKNTYPTPTDISGNGGGFFSSLWSGLTGN